MSPSLRTICGMIVFSCASESFHSVTAQSVVEVIDGRFTSSGGFVSVTFASHVISRMSLVDVDELPRRNASQSVLLAVELSDVLELLALEVEIASTVVVKSSSRASACRGQGSRMRGISPGGKYRTQRQLGSDTQLVWALSWGKGGVLRMHPIDSVQSYGQGNNSCQY